jgi:hypothetical protein
LGEAFDSDGDTEGHGDAMTKLDYRMICQKLRGENDTLAAAWEAAKGGVAQANVEIGRLNAHLNDATKRMQEMQEMIDRLSCIERETRDERTMLIRAITAVVTQ